MCVYIYVYVVYIYIYTHTMEYYSHKKIMPFAATWVDLETIILSKVNQKEKDKYHITYMWKLK